MSDFGIIAGVTGAALLGLLFLDGDEKKTKRDNKTVTREGFNELGEVNKLTVGDFSNYAFSRPNFKATPTPRFDPYRTASGTVRDKQANFPAGAYVSSFSTQASEAYPVNESMMQGAEEAADYTSLADIEYDVNSYKESCKNSTGIRKQYNSTMKQKSGMESYTDPKEMLPPPNPRSCIPEDPRNPDVYMSGNTIGFKSRGGRATRSNHDHIRGDLVIDPAPILTMPMNVSTSTLSGGAINSGIIAEAPPISDPINSFGKDTQYFTAGHKFGLASGEYVRTPINEVDEQAISGANPGQLYKDPKYLRNPWGDLQSNNV